MKKRKATALDALISGRFRRFTVTATALQILDHHLDSLKLGVTRRGAAVLLQEVVRVARDEFNRD